MASVTKTTLHWVLKDDVTDKARGIGSTLGNLVNPMNLAIGAAAGLGVALVASVKAAAEEQINIEKLNASLVANVEGFDGNTAAIEELISQRENLAFSDDEQRASLAILLAATNDVTEAQDLQATAMDLARLKGVDLATATTAIAKASEGSTRELKALGIAVDDTMASTEILTAVQAAAAGQAEAYGDTLQGKWETFQIKIGDVSEDLGALLIGPLTDLADFLLDEVVPAVSDLVEAIGPALQESMDMAGAGLDVLSDALSPLLALLDDGTAKAWSLVDALKAVANTFTPLGLGGISQTLYNQMQSRTTRAPVSSGFQRAAGGPVEAGGAYLVGEEGPEWLQMGNQSGSIIPGGASGGSPVELPIMVDGEVLARVVDRRLFLAVQAAGGGYRPR